ncbi:hypothetical protein NDU88_009159 [Pleurodeles waltl]|uniref:Uncharacterized protein n=1 Tax=Pleurodeles waltl TaxID=8319 RepID=A0AAV7PRA9_PLEWA|nr:hypothetical protein NDU88_009159 [Pleurodeles waltl]
MSGGCGRGTGAPTLAAPRSEEGAKAHRTHWQGSMTTQPPQMQDTLQKILEAIEDSKKTLRQEIRKVSVELAPLRTDHWKLTDRVKNTEEDLKELGTSHCEE